MSYVNSLVRKHRLKPADVVVVNKAFFGLLDHYLVFAGYDRAGRPCFVANMEGGVKFLREDYINGQSDWFSINRVRRFEGSETQRGQAMARAKSLLGKPYSKLQFNCEHFANYVQKGRSYSKQVETASSIGTGLAVGLGLLAVVGLVSSFYNEE